jgi:tRNA A37 threonylcarbamoyltransferase TsaD
LLVDNGAMIGFLGEIMLNSKIKMNVKDFDKLDINPRERTDMVEVRWR